MAVAADKKNHKKHYATSQKFARLLPYKIYQQLIKLDLLTVLPKIYRHSP